jgi:hypothetical protein
MKLRADKIKPRVEYKVREKVWLYTPQRSTKTMDKDGTTVHLAKVSLARIL